MKASRYGLNASLLAALLALTASSSFSDEGGLQSFSVSGTVFSDLNGNGIRDAGEPGIEGVYVSNGELLARSGADGGYSLSFSATEPARVFVSTPAGWRAKGGFSALAKPGACELDFPLLRDENSAKAEFSFIAGSDIHSRKEPARLAADMKELAGIASWKNAAFAAFSGDLTNDGDAESLADLKQALDLLPIPSYPVYAGHDGLQSKPAPGTSFVANLAPLHYSWNAGDCHFLALVSEYDYVEASEVERQRKWIDADLSVLPPGSNLAVFTHTPERMAKELKDAAERRQLRLLGIFRGHFHMQSLLFYGSVPVIDSAPMYSWQWGAMSKKTRVVAMGPEGVLATETRILSLPEYAVVSYPQGEIKRLAFVQASLYDSKGPIDSASFSIKGVSTKLEGALSKCGEYSWRADMKDGEELPDGDYEIAVEARSNSAQWSCARSFKIAKSAAAKPPLSLAWAHPTYSTSFGFSAPVSDGESVFIGLSSGQIGPARNANSTGALCLSLESGAERWRSLEGEDCAAPLACDGKCVFAMNSEGTVFCLDKANGETLWKTRLRQANFEKATFNWQSSLSPLRVASGRVYAASFIDADASLYCLDAKDGRIIWKKDRASRDRYILNFALDGDRALFSSCEGSGAISLADGRSLWTIKTPGSCASPEASSGKVFLSLKNSARAVNVKDGSTSWERPLPDLAIFYAQPALCQASLMVPRGGKLFALSPDNGSILWEFQGKGGYGANSRNHPIWNTAKPCAAGANRALLPSDDGSVYLLDARTGAKLGQFNAGFPFKSSPVSSKGRIVLAGFDGCLYCFETN